MHVAAIGPQVENRIADDLPGTVIRDVAAASGVVHLDASRGELRLEEFRRQLQDIDERLSPLVALGFDLEY